MRCEWMEWGQVEHINLKKFIESGDLLWLLSQVCSNTVWLSSFIKLFQSRPVQHHLQLDRSRLTGWDCPSSCSLHRKCWSFRRCRVPSGSWACRGLFRRGGRFRRAIRVEIFRRSRPRSKPELLFPVQGPAYRQPATTITKMYNFHDTVSTVLVC